MSRTGEILSRRKTVRNIHKITRTMEMVASARFKRVHDWVENLRPYTEAISQMVYNLARSPGAGADRPLLKEHPEASRDALMVVASNRGMCGGYNIGVLRKAQRRYDELVGRGRQVDVYSVGTRARSYLRLHQIPVRLDRPQFEGRVSIEEVAEIAEDLMRRYVGGELATVQVAHSEYHSASVQRPTILTLLPLGELSRVKVIERERIGRATGAREYDYVPDPGAILDQLLPRAICLRLYRALLDAMAGEQVARMTAMRLATENAEDMIRELTMRYNRARQGTITAELAEIIGGSEAMA